MSGKAFRRWCTPKMIMVVMRPSDDPAQVFTAIQYAERSGAKLLLVQLSGRLENGKHSILSGLQGRGSVHADCGQFPPTDALKRAFVLKDVPIQQLSSIVRTFNIDQVVITQSRCPELATQPGLEEPLIAALNVPVCILGSGVHLNRSTAPGLHRILLPVAHWPEIEYSLKFAWSLAKSQRAGLSILHTCETPEGELAADKRWPLSVSPWLHSFTRGLSSHPPIEMWIRHGDPAAAIIEFNARKPHDLLILRCSPDRHLGSYSHSKIVAQLCSEMPCPVLVLGKSIRAPALYHARTQLRAEPLGMEV